MIALLAFSCSKKDEIDQNGFKTYSNKELSFSILYPAKWVMQKRVTGPVFIHPSKKSVPAVINVVVNRTDKKDSIDSFNSEINEKLPKQIPGFKWHDKRSVLLSGLPAKLILYSSPYQEKDRIMYLQVFTIKNNLSFLISYIVLKSDFEKYRNIVDKMIESFKILDK